MIPGAPRRTSHPPVYLECGDGIRERGTKVIVDALGCVNNKASNKMSAQNIEMIPSAW